ncbi:MAG: LysR family transcriptional regulator [Thermaerobacter sp.]|nr:LysR family transcriptional regulator [Thermaerobacter sp.]
MNEQLWTTFKTVAEIGAISKAARHLNLSQSAVSQQIQQLEHHYECQLFTRTGHGVALTESGEVVYRYVTTLLQTLAESRRTLIALRTERPAPLRIGASMTIAEYVLPQVLPRFCTTESLPRISVIMANSRTTFDNVLHQDLDFGLVEAALTDPRLVVRPFLEDRPMAVTASHHPWRTRTEVSVEEFLAEPIILREAGSGTRMAIEEALQQIGLGVHNLKIELVLGTTQAIKSMVLANVGIAVLSPLAILPHETGLFHQVRVVGLNLRRHFSIVHPRDFTSRLGQRFIHQLFALDWVATPRPPAREILARPSASPAE